jgi:hypothetical protein
VTCIGTARNAFRILVEKREERDCFENVGVGGRLTLNLIMNK